jgi:predicted enzyme related to lactoylglutathione lyase
MRGRASWWDIQVDDLAVAQRFYGEVFGWTFPMSGPDFVVVSDGTELVGQLYASNEPVSGRGIRMYFETADLEGVLAKVSDAGGKVKSERALISPEMGWFGEFTDPSGVVIGLWTRTPAT